MRLLPDSPINLSQHCFSSSPRLSFEYTEFTSGSRTESDFRSILPSAYTAVVPCPPITAPRLFMNTEKALSRSVILWSSIKPMMPSGAIRIPVKIKIRPADTPRTARITITAIVSGTTILSMAWIDPCSLDVRSRSPWLLGSSGTDVYIRTIPNTEMARMTAYDILNDDWRSVGA